MVVTYALCFCKATVFLVDYATLMRPANCPKLKSGTFYSQQYYNLDEYDVGTWQVYHIT